MPRAHIVKTAAIKRTPRLMQMEGIFDLPPDTKSVCVWDVDFELPSEWNIGLIVGPSGSGKTIISRECFREFIAAPFDWPTDQSVLDGFPEGLGIKNIVQLLSSVGFSSPPSWVRPFHLLSNGEQFRVNVARALAEKSECCLIDEFTSVVDRRVAQIGSAAIAKAVRRMKRRFIAVSCHYDIAEWLAQGIQRGLRRTKPKGPSNQGDGCELTQSTISTTPTSPPRGKPAIGGTVTSRRAAKV